MDTHCQPMDSDNLKALLNELDGLETELTSFEQTVKDYHHAYSECRKIEARCLKELHHQEYRTSQVEQSLKGIKLSNDEEIKLTAEIKERIKTHKQRITEANECLPTNNSLYLKVILGGINATLVDKEEKFQYKEQYEKFKLVVNALILVVALLDVLFSYRVIDAFLHFLLVWYHCTLTIRESILIVNGSRIKGWWRALQFITGIKAGIIIVWPDGLMYDLFRKQFLYYIVYTSFLQFLQFYYQHNCLYRLRALGERYEMDITIQGFHSWMWKGLGFLIPFLYMGYAFQFYNAYTLYNLSKHPLCSEWQVAVSCLIFSIIFLGNIITTSLVVQQKFKEKMINRIQQTLNLPKCPSVSNLLKKDG